MVLNKLNTTEYIQKALCYLHEHQFPNGEFVTYASSDPEMESWTRPESNNFVTALIIHAIYHAEDNPIRNEIAQKALGFLAGQVGIGGTWNFFTKYHIYRYLCASDLDDTSCISSLYRDYGVYYPFKDNKRLILCNRSKGGLFYTWFVLRFKWIRNRTFWKLTLGELIRPVKSLVFWYSVEANRNDIDGVVNANVLYYLGKIKETEPIIDFINEIIQNKKEGDCDLWYRDPFVVYYFFSRNYYNGIKELEPIKNPIIHRVLTETKPDGRLGNTILETAWGLCTLMNLGYKGQEINDAVEFLLSMQLKTGSWPRWIAFYGGPKKLQGFGSEELTTAFCIEALAKYQKHYPIIEST